MASPAALLSRAPESVEVKALVVFTAPSHDRSPGSATLLGDVSSTLAEDLSDAIAALKLTGKDGETAAIPASPLVRADVIVLAGTGISDSEKYSSPEGLESVRRAAGAAVRSASGQETIAVVPPVDEAEVAVAALEGALLGAYSFARYRTSDAAARPVPQVSILTSTARSRDARHGSERALALVTAVNAVRDLVNTAPADLTPAAFAEIATKAAAAAKIKVAVLDEQALVAGGYGGIMGVGQGSANPPRLVTLSYAPARAKKHVALVGKGITFDSGGLSLKPPTGMITMKSDMAGAAAVMHTVLMAAELGLPIRVTGFLALAENMPSGAAIRPSDVLTMRGGKTVEVLNTDAEGRLVMADALVDAVALEPDVVIDIATLTGAQLVALGPRVTGIMGDDAIRTAVVTSADEAGEQAWPMPLPSELRPGLDSTIADIANIGDKFGGMLVAGLFLKEFVGTTPWAHLDIAGPSFNEGAPWGYTPKGGTGAGVRTLITYLETIARS